VCCLLKSEHKNKAAPVILCIILLASFIFWNLSALAGDNAFREYGKLIQLRLGHQALNASQVTGILEKRDFENEDTRYTAWSQESGVTLENDSLGLHTQLDSALFYYGDNFGKFNLILDNGCALSEDAAFKVFGTTEGIPGEFVAINGERHIVEKLMYGNQVHLIYKVKENSRASFDVLDIIPGPETDFSPFEFRMNFGINSDIVIHYGDVTESFRTLGKFILWAALIFAVLFFLNGITRGADKLFRRTVMYAGLFLTAFSCYTLVGSPVFIPDSFIPTRWSEFEFWSAAFAQFKDALRYYFSMKTYVPDIIFRSYILQTLIFALIAAMLIIFASTAGCRIIKERGIKIGTGNFKEHYEAIRRKLNSRRS
jgi:hypothetical protein